MKQPLKTGAPPRAPVSAAEAARLAATSVGAALSARDPHLLMTVAEKMAQSAVVFANNAKTNATMMKGTAQVFHFYLSIFYTYISHCSPRGSRRKNRRNFHLEALE